MNTKKDGKKEREILHTNEIFVSKSSCIHKQHFHQPNCHFLCFSLRISISVYEGVMGLG